MIELTEEQIQEILDGIRSSRPKERLDKEHGEKLYSVAFVERDYTLYFATPGKPLDQGLSITFEIKVPLITIPTCL